MGGALSRLRAAQREFAQRPAFARWAAEDALYLPEFAEELAAGGIDPRPLSATIQEAEEAATYAREALEYRAWDAASEDMGRAIGAIERIVAATRPTPPVRAPRLRRRTTARLVRGMILLFVEGSSPSFGAWRRLDVALLALSRARRGANAERTRWVVAAFASPERLRPFVLRAVRSAHHEARAEADRLLDEAQEAFEYALAALDLRALSTFPTDLDRLDSALRALRHIVQRESAVYLPEPWPVVIPARYATRRLMRREANAEARTMIGDLEVRLRERGIEIGPP